VCTHIPIHPQSLLSRKYPGRCINAHGHTHRNNVKLPGTEVDDPRYFNLSVEMIDYTPVHHDVLIERAKALRDG
jgi:calcineurin-like phosphoesterase family protein